MPLVSVAANFTSTANIAFDTKRHIREVYCLARSTSRLYKELGPHRGARVMDVEQMTNRTICGPNQSESPERLLTHQSGPTTPHGCTFGRAIDQRTPPRGTRAVSKGAHGNAHPTAVTSVKVVKILGWLIEVIGQAACVSMLRRGSVLVALICAKASTCARGSTRRGSTGWPGRFASPALRTC